MIDWDLFSARVPAGTRVKMSTETVEMPDDLLLGYIEGIVWRFQENDPEDCEEEPYLYPEDAWMHDGVIWIFPFAYLDDFWLDPSQSEYFIDGRWQTFDQLMQP